MGKATVLRALGTILFLTCGADAFATENAQEMPVAAEATEPQATTEPKTDGLDPWVGKYCMSLFTKTRTAAMVGKGHGEFTW